MTAPPPVALQRPLTTRRPTAQQNRFVDLYNIDGTMLTFQTEEQLTRMLGDVIAVVRSFDLQYPYRLTLNLPWSIGAAAEEDLHARVKTAIVMQITGDRQTLTKCTETPGEWDPTTILREDKCMFSRFFAARPPTHDASPAAAFRTRIQPAALDNVALFPRPYLLRFLKKETSQKRVGGRQIDYQKWYGVQGCTNCLAAGTFQMCTHYINAAMLRLAGIAWDEAEVA